MARHTKGKAFRGALRVRAVGIEKNASEALRKVALFIDQAVVMATPVDTGRARSNWVVTTGSPFTTVISPYAPGSKLGIAETGNTSGALAQAQGVLSVPGKLDAIFITNNVHYIGKLNSPSTPSAQAPPYFVQRAIKDAIIFLRGTVRLMRRI